MSPHCVHPDLEQLRCAVFGNVHHLHDLKGLHGDWLAMLWTAGLVNMSSQVFGRKLDLVVSVPEGSSLTSINRPCVALGVINAHVKCLGEGLETGGLAWLHELHGLMGLSLPSCQRKTTA